MELAGFHRGSLRSIGSFSRRVATMPEGVAVNINLCDCYVVLTVGSEMRWQMRPRKSSVARAVALFKIRLYCHAYTRFVLLA